MGCHFLFQEIFPTQGSNPGLTHCRQMLYHLSHPGSPFCVCVCDICCEIVAQTVKRLPAMWETWVRFLGWEDLLEKEMAIHSSILA